MEQGTTIKEDPGDTITTMSQITDGIISPASDAARRFAEASELIIPMGNNFPNEDLYNLCLVNTRFNAIFSQQLYRNIVLNEKFLQPNNLVWSPSNRRFCHTKTLTFDETTEVDVSLIPGYEPSDGGPSLGRLPEWICALVQKTATGVLRNCPNLHTINLDSILITSDRAVLIINNGLDDRLKRSTHQLQTLALSLDASPCRELSVSIFQQQNLKSLSLVNIPTRFWRAETVCRILKASPGLRYLSLSYLFGFNHAWHLERLCELYKQLGGAPLSLETLVLGEGIYLHIPKQELLSGTGLSLSSSATYLSLLTNPASIREIGVIATNTLAWGTFDLSFLPKLKEFRLSSGPVASRTIDDFFGTVKARNLLTRVHFHVDGWYFTNYPNTKAMIRKIFAPRDENDASTSLAPVGFSFPIRFPEEDKYKRSIAMPLPTTRFLDIAIYYPRLVGFVTKGLSEMAALEFLTLKVYVYDASQWDGRQEVEGTQLEVLRKVADACPRLRYVRMQLSNLAGDYQAFGPNTYPVPPAIDGLSRSWKIDRKRRPDSRSRRLHPYFTILDAKADKSLRPQSMWSEQEKRDQYITETQEPLEYHAPLWMK